MSSSGYGVEEEEDATLHMIERKALNGAWEGLVADATEHDSAKENTRSG